MQPLFEHRRWFAGYDTRVLELEGEGPAMVLIHGFADSADTWRLVLQRLARAERRALAVDLPGFATAGCLRPGKMLPQLDAFVADALDYAVREDGEPAVLVGNSLGGTVALRGAQRCEELPIDAAVPIAPAGFDLARWLRLLEGNPLVQLLLGVPAPLPEAVVREMVARVYCAVAFARPADVERAVVDGFTSHLRNRATVARYMRTARRLLPELADAFELERITCPVMLIWGDRDRMVSVEGSERMLEALPDTRFELLEGAGHCPQIEEADVVAELLLEFAPALPRAA